MKFLFLGLLLVGLILVSGCTQQKDQQELVEEKVEEPLQETNLTENTTVSEEIKEVKEIEPAKEEPVKKEEIKKTTLKSLPCSEFFQCFMYCRQNMQTCSEYCQSNPSDMTCQEIKSMSDSFGGEAVTGDFETPLMSGSQEIQKFIKTDFIELDKIKRISKYRAGYGHDYSRPSNEKCRSMKHYYWAKGGMPGGSHTPAWTSIKYFSPVDGKISALRDKKDMDGDTEYQFMIIPDQQPSYYLNFFHVNLLPEFQKGGKVKEGQHIGYLSDEYVHGEIAVQTGSTLVSYFDIITDELFDQYKKKGAKSREDFAISKEERDKKPLNCDPKTEEGRFIGVSEDGLKDSTGLASWFEMK